MSDITPDDSQRFSLVRRGDELWMTTRDNMLWLEKLVTDSLEPGAELPFEVYNPDPHGVPDQVIDCMRVCLAQTILEGGKYPVTNCDFDSFLVMMMTFVLILENPDLSEKGIDEVRKVIWGYARSNLTLMAQVSKEYLGQVEPSSFEDAPVDVLDPAILQRTRMMLSCAFIAYVEVRLRDREAEMLEEAYGNKEDYER